MKTDFPFNNTDLSLNERLSDLMERLTLDEKIALIPTRQAGIERLGIKPYSIGAEGAHGFVDRKGKSTVFPQTLGLSCTWNRELLHKIGDVIGTEARVYYNRNKEHGLSLWFPTIDMERDPRWGRTEEAYGEDPYLAGELASQIVAGTQGDDDFYIKASCAPKHFMANNNEKHRSSGNSSINPRELNEYYLAPFRNVFTNDKVPGAKPFSIMTSYNQVNGVPMMMNSLVLEKVQKEWGLKDRGHVVSDGGAVSMVKDAHHYTKSHTETVAGAFKVGVDSMTDTPEMVISAVKEGLKKGIITEQEIDEHVAAVLRVRFRYGQFDPEGMCPYDALGEDSMMTKESAQLAREAFRQSTVLLKNSKSVTGRTLLPLSVEQQKADKQNIAVIGPLANQVFLDWYSGNYPYAVTPLQSLKETYGEENILFEDGRDIVEFYTEDGKKPLILDNENCLSVGMEGTEPARFIVDDWGWGAYTLYNEKTGKYLNTVDDMPSDHQPSAEEIEAYKEMFLSHTMPAKVAACADSTWAWFITTIFNIVPTDGVESGKVILRAWTGASVLENSECVEKTTSIARLKVIPDDTPSVFTMHIVKDGKKAAAEVAAKANTAVIIAGNNPLINGKEEMDRPDITLPQSQSDLINSVYSSNPDTILVLQTSYPIACVKENDYIPAILYTPHGFQEGGNGLVDILSGYESPAGRLSMTWYKSVEELPKITDYNIITSKMTYQYYKGETLYPFGYGLSYSSFSYSNLKLSIKGKSNVDNEHDTIVLEEGSPVIVSFTVTNTGNCTASEVPQMYISIKGSRVERPLLTLRGFDRFTLEPGKSRNVEFELKASDTAIWDVVSGKFCVEESVCIIGIGSSSKNIFLSTEIPVAGCVIGSRDFMQLTEAWNYDACDGCSLLERKKSIIPAVFTDNGKGSVLYRDVSFKTDTTYFVADVCTDGVAYLVIKVGSIEVKVDLPNTGFNNAVPGDKIRAAWVTSRAKVQIPIGVYDVQIELNGAVGIHSFRFE